MTFDSVYEMTNPLTTVRKQHFWDWCSGSTLNSRWTQTNTCGATTGMDDAVNGGIKLSTSATAHGDAFLEFNDKWTFAPTGSVMIAVITPAQTTNTRFICSLGDVQGSFTNSHGVRHESGNTYYKLMVNFSTLTDSSIALDTSKHVHRTESTASSVTLRIDGVLEATNSVTSPTTTLQPLIEVYNKGVAVNDIYNLHYFEAYNT